MVHDLWGDFETSLIEHFYQCWNRWLDVPNPYADWLVNGIRRIQTERAQLHSLITTHFKGPKALSSQEQEEIYTLLQVLSFLRTLPGEKERLAGISYYRIEFPLQDFARSIGREGKYHQGRLSEILRSLSYVNRPILEVFADSFFQSYLPIPVVQFDNRNHRSILKLVIQEQLYFYRYSFRFPNQFLQESGKTDRKIKLFLIQVMTDPALRKEFPVADLLGQFSYSNQKKKTVRDRIVGFLTVLVQENFVESQMEVRDLKTEILRPIDAKELTSSLILKTKIIYLTEILNSRFSEPFSR